MKKLLTAFALIALALPALAAAATTVGLDITTAGNTTLASTTISKHVAIGPDASLNNDAHGQGAGDISAVIAETFSGSAENNLAQGLAVTPFMNMSNDDTFGFGITMVGGTAASMSHDTPGFQGFSSYPTHAGSGLMGYMYGVYSSMAVKGTGDVTDAYGLYSNLINFGAGGRVHNLYQVYAGTPVNSGFNPDLIVDYWGGDLAGTATNPYYSWYDSQGVQRCKEDNTYNSVGQAICVLYNPQFAKYTAGAADFERIVYGQWNSNVAEIGAEKGGTGVQRQLRLLGSAVNLVPVATAALPTCTEGSMKPVTDSNTATWGATIAGGGSNHVLAYCNGTNWTVMAK